MMKTKRERKKTSKNHEFNQNDIVGAEQLYLLSWFDSIDRLDTLLLEARHLQLNTIYSLREPRLYLPLRYEEVGLWGRYRSEGGKVKSWEDYFDNNDKRYDPDLTEEIIISYPSPSNHKKESQGETGLHRDEEHNVIREKLIKTISKTWIDGGWGQDQKQAYFTLMGLQLLKREILRDKLILCRHAYQESKIHHSTYSKNMENTGSPKAQFMILRGAIMHRASRDYVSRLQEYHQQLGQIVDIDSDGLPKSSIERRREIYLYAHFLNERTLGIQADMNSLIVHLFGKKLKESDEKQLPNSINTIVTHNWQQSHLSTSKDYETISHKSKKRLSHISTHFWMPERPDLQPIIAHEVAHSFIRVIYEDLKRSRMSVLQDDFSYLLLRIQYVIDDYRGRRPRELGLDATTITREIACDFMAATLKGFPYLYAFFIEYVGQHFSFEGLLKSGGNKLDIERLHLSKAGRVGANLYDSREWYLRTRVLLEWTKHVHHRELSYLEKDLLKGVKKIIDDILDYYIEIAANDDQAEDERMWRYLSDHICKIIKLQKPCKQAYKWRGKRSKSKYKDDGQPGEGDFLRHAKRLDTRVRDHLFRMQVNLKLLPERPLQKLMRKDPLIGKEHLDLIFNQFYISDDENKHQKIVTTEEDKKCQKAGKGPLYKHIYDIPWQCALMRSKDVLWRIENFDEEKQKIKVKANTYQYSKVLDILHDKFPLGRDLFSYALEFYLYEAQSPKDRLSDVFSLHEAGDSKTKEKILEGIISNEEQIKELIRKSSRFTCDPEGDQESGVILAKIQENLENLENLKKHQKSLYNYIKSHSKDENENDFHELIIQSLSFYNYNIIYQSASESIQLIRGSDETKSSKELYKIYLIGRGAIAGSYSTARNEVGDDVPNVIEKYKFHDKTNNNWQYNWAPGERYYRPKEELYYKTLGRHDILSISRTNLLCHCPLPIFDKKHFNKNPLEKVDKLSIYNEINEEVFPTFSTRKELALPVRLNLDVEWPFRADQEKYPEIVSAIFVTLKQPVFRLSFLYRLLTTIKDTPKDQSKNVECLEDVGGLFESDDCAFLTDGKSDLMILLTKSTTDGGTKDIDRTFNIQDALYEDFMVNRTSMVFMASTMEQIKKDDLNYSMIVRLRMIEDRGLDRSNHANSFDKIDNIYKIAGQYDFEFNPLETSNFGGVCGTAIPAIEKVLENNKYLDRIETVIQKKWNP